MSASVVSSGTLDPGSTYWNVIRVRIRRGLLLWSTPHYRRRSVESRGGLPPGTFSLRVANLKLRIPPLPEPRCHSRGEHQVVVIAFAPVRVGVMRGVRVNLHPEIEQLLLEGLSLRKLLGYLEATVLEEHLHRADEVSFGHLEAGVLRVEGDL